MTQAMEVEYTTRAWTPGTRLRIFSRCPAATAESSPDRCQVKEVTGPPTTSASSLSP